MSHFAATLFVSVATGLALSMLFVTPAALGAKFFRLNAMIAMVLAVIATGTATFSRREGSLFSALLLLYSMTVLWLPPLIERLLLAMATLWGGKLVWDLLAVQTGHELWAWGEWISVISGGCVIAFAVAAMNLGHSYLAAAKLSMKPLRLLTAGLAALLVGRGAWMIISAPILLLISPSASAALSHVVRERDMFLWTILIVRVLFGVIGPFLLTVMTWETLKIRSTQSATGILYAVVAMVCVGEASALYLMFATGVPL